MTATTIITVPGAVPISNAPYFCICLVLTVGYFFNAVINSSFLIFYVKIIMSKKQNVLFKRIFMLKNNERESINQEVYIIKAKPLSILTQEIFCITSSSVYHNLKSTWQYQFKTFFCLINSI